jgi:Trk K+ transport system NAD-binding subunit
LLQPRRLVPAGMENILVLGLVVALFQLAEAIHVDSGLTAVVAAGMVVGNTRMRARRELFEFKEQLTVLLIGLLFVLLAADVRLRDVYELGWPAIWTVAALMLIVRPVQVALCTWRSTLSIKERAFIALLAPRGIVAAAVASLFAQQLAERGVDGAAALRGLVFLVIAATVTIHGLTGPFIARALDVRRPSRNGFVVLGANPLARAVSGVLRDDGHELVLIDNNAERVVAAQAAGFKVLYGQGLQAGMLGRADVDSRLACIALTPNEEVNLLFAAKVREETRIPELYVALRREHDGVPAENVHNMGGAVLFGRSRRLDVWNQRLDQRDATVEVWTRALQEAPPAGADESIVRSDMVLVLAVRRRGRMQPFGDDTTLGAKEEIAVAVADAGRQEAEALLSENGWALAAREAKPATVT